MCSVLFSQTGARGHGIFIFKTGSCVLPWPLTFPVARDDLEFLNPLPPSFKCWDNMCVSPWRWLLSSFLVFKPLLFILCVWGLACRFLCTMRVQYQRRPEEGTGLRRRRYREVYHTQTGVISCHQDAGNQTWILQKRVEHFSSPPSL